MGSIFVATASGVQSQHTEEELQNLQARGLISEGTMYWKEGMSDWRPIEEWFAGRSSEGGWTNSQLTENNSYTYSKDPIIITKFLSFMLGVSVLSELLFLWSSVGQLRLLESPFTPQQAEENDARQGLISLVYLGVFFVTGITFLMWIHRANRNCRGFGAVNMTFTPGWSVGYYFIPILNWFKPYQAMKEIWQVSQEPGNWQQVKPSVLLGLWWFFWISSGLIGQASMRLSLQADTVEKLVTSTKLAIFSCFFNLPLCVVAFLVVKDIIKKQQALVLGNK